MLRFAGNIRPYKKTPGVGAGSLWQQRGSSASEKGTKILGPNYPKAASMARAVWSPIEGIQWE
jgi:hypothetical protein